MPLVHFPVSLSAYAHDDEEPHSDGAGDGDDHDLSAHGFSLS